MRMTTTIGAAKDCVFAQSTAQGSVQGSVPTWQYVQTRASDLDAAAEAAGPGFAVVADAHGVRGIVRYDVEAGCPHEAIPADGWVS